MYTITKEFAFSASHILKGLAKGHPCSRMHGHNYVVKVELASNTLDQTAFVQDYGKLKPIKEFIDSKLDHKFIAESLEQAANYNLTASEVFVLGKQSSAENLAKFLFDEFSKQFPKLTVISISETPKTWACFRPIPSSCVDVSIQGKDLQGIDLRSLDDKV